MATEYVDIINERGELTGESRPYNDVHKFGLLHRAVHVWIVNSQNQLLMQKRASNKQAYPDYWDISASGHISASETSLEGAKKETQQELGLSLPDTAFQYLFTIEGHVVLNNGTFVNNEFQDVYLVQLDTPLPDTQLTDGEVSDVRWLDLQDFKLWVNNPKYKTVPHQEEYNLLLNRIKNNPSK